MLDTESLSLRGEQNNTLTHNVRTDWVNDFTDPHETGDRTQAVLLGLRRGWIAIEPAASGDGT